MGQPARLSAALCFLAALAAAAPAAPAAAVALMPHKATYALALDGSRPSGRLEALSGQIDYEIRGDACEGYATVTRQANETDSGEGAPERSAVSSTAWESPNGDTYRFQTASSSTGETSSLVEATVSRDADGLKVSVAKPRREEIELKGRILMPTEHVRKVLEAAAAGESLLEAKVYDGTTEAGKVFDTLAVIGAPGTDDAKAPVPARAALAGHTSYPVSISYYEPGSGDRTPAYVMSVTFYDNGVVGKLRIDYGTFTLNGTMTRFEALKRSGNCAR